MQRETKLNPPPAEWSPPLDRGRERATAGEAWLEVARRVAADLWDVPPAALLLDTRFREDLGVHDLDVAELLQEVEDALGRRFFSDAYRRVNSLGQLLRELGGGRPAPADAASRPH